MSAADGVLLVDDDADIREVVQMVLEIHGYRVTTASDGAEALAHLRGGARPCLILLDIMMPVMSGPEFRAAQLCDPALAKIPVVVLSGDTRAPDRAATLQTEVLKKPIELPALVNLVGRFCGKNATAAS